ncbi:MAG: DUF3857 and transglutaminase domain-containing protein [Gemmatimonadaceae bacterium]
MDLTLRIVAASSLLLAVASPCGAQGRERTPQAGVTIPAVPPTPADDSLYRLAVDPTKYEGEPTHLLSDATTIRVERDGSVVRTFRRVMQVLTDAGATHLREQQFGYVPGHQSIDIHWVRVVRPDGSVVSAAPSQIQESDVPAPVSASPVYSDQKIVRMSLSGITTGTILDVDFTVIDRKPPLPGDFAQTYVFTPGSSIERTRFELDVPSSMKPSIREENLDFRRVTETDKGRTHYIWARKNTPKIRGEPFATDSNGVVMRVRVGGALTWNDVSHWYAGLARDRYAATPNLTRVVDSVVAAAKPGTRDDSIRAVHRWVAQDIRYVGIELGIGGYQPRMPDTVIATGYGDCKDKATLFVAALGHLGITAYPVLLSINATARRDIPSAGQFNHEIAAVPVGNGNYQFVDLTSSFSAYGELPLSIQGGFALVIFPDGQNQEVTLPTDAPTANVQTTTLDGELSSSGKFNGYYEEAATGAMAAGMRASFASQPDSAQRAEAGRRIARRYFSTGDGDSLTGFNGRDYSAAARVRIRIHDANATTMAGPVVMLNNPFSTLSAMAGAADDMARLPERKFPIDASKIIGLRTSVTELRVKLPEGWHARLPVGVTATSVFGSYTSRYEQQGQELVISRRLVGAGGIFMPSRGKELIEWLRAIGRDDVKLIVLDKPQ